MSVDSHVVVKNYSSNTALCMETLSWWMDQSWFLHRSRWFRQTCSLGHCKTCPY